MCISFHIVGSITTKHLTNMIDTMHATKPSYSLRISLPFCLFFPRVSFFCAPFRMGAAISVPPSHWSSSIDSKGSVLCFFCGGASCPYENYQFQINGNAIQGLHSSWILPSVLAMQRPSSRLIKMFSIIEQFKMKEIGAVVNLQECGEHALCGDGITESGFSYRPEEFMDHGIFFYNFGWLDLAKPTRELMLRIVQVLRFTVVEQGKKVAVHCHAGLGRTGLAIACFLIYAYHYSAADAVGLVRKQRPGSVQTDAQYLFCEEFATWIASLKKVFNLAPVEEKSLLTIVHIMQQQSILLHGEESRKLRFIPKIVDLISKKIMKENPHAVVMGFLFHEEWNPILENRLDNIKRQCNAGDWEFLDVEIKFLCQLFLDWLDHLADPLISLSLLSELESKHHAIIPIFDQKAINPQLDHIVRALSIPVFLTLERILRILVSLESFCSENCFQLLQNRFAIALIHAGRQERSILSLIHPSHSV